MIENRGVVLLVFALFVSHFASAQQVSSTWVSTGDFQSHRFWDRENKILFAAHAGLAATDFALTHRNLASGGEELNPIAKPFTDMGTPGEVVFFAGGTAASIGITYLLHKTHHHVAERWAARFGVADSATGVIFNLAQGGPTAPKVSTAAIGIRFKISR